MAVGLRHGVRHIVAARDEARPRACALAAGDGQHRGHVAKGARGERQRGLMSGNGGLG